MDQPPGRRPPAGPRASTLIEPQGAPLPLARPAMSPAGRGATIIESDEEDRSRALRIPLGPSPAAAAPSAGPRPRAEPGGAEPFRPTARPPVAVLTVLDDGSDDGEAIRLRGDRFVIGRSEGDLTLPHDSRVSARHVEIARREAPGGWRWVVTDLGSTNGLFVRVRRALLTDGVELIVGSGRYRFEAPRASAPSPAARGATVAWGEGGRETGLPALVELIGGEVGGRTILTGPDAWIGKGPACAIRRPDDPFCDPGHAKISRGPSSEWVAENNRSLNGLWLRMAEVEVAATAQFQIGEQRLRLAVPPRAPS